MNNMIHEVKNHLAVAVANVEAFRDGVFEPSPARLEAVLQALAEVDVLLGQLPHGMAAAPLVASMKPMDVCSVITNEVLALEASAQQHGVTFEVHQCESTGEACRRFGGDPTRVAEIVNNVVSNAIRYTSAGRRIAVTLATEGRDAVLTVGGASALPAHAMSQPGGSLRDYMRDQELTYVNRALAQVNGDKEKAAELLGVSVATLYRKLAEEDAAG